jgi:hypothetical protein
VDPFDVIDEPVRIIVNMNEVQRRFIIELFPSLVVDLNGTILELTTFNEMIPLSRFPGQIYSLSSLVSFH